MTREDVRMLAENRIRRKKRFSTFLFWSLLFNLLVWFVVLENEPEAIGFAYTISGIFLGLTGILAGKAYGTIDMEQLKRTRRERKIRKEMAKIEEELEEAHLMECSRAERLRLKELSLRYPESDFV